MASRVSIQIRIDQAITRLENVLQAAGIQSEFPRQARGGQDMIRAVQLELIASAVEKLAAQQTAGSEDEPKARPRKGK